jgi:hypothetical protein
MLFRKRLYWQRDHDLSVDGRRLVAELLARPETRNSLLAN